MTDSASSKIAKRLRRRATFWSRFYVSAGHHPFSKEELSELRAFCLFVGYPRSGSTLLASMLSAHPDILLGHELDALGFVRWGAGKNQMLHAIRSSADAFTQSGRRWEGYDYRIGGPYENAYRRLRIVGDKEAAMSAVRLSRDPSLFLRLREVVGLPIKVVHIVRNPFDNLATMYLRGRYPILHLPLSRCIDDFTAMVCAIEELKERLDPEELIEVRHEDVVERPTESLKRLCEFLDVDSDSDYIASATKIVKPTVNRSRERLVWHTADVRRVDEIIAGSTGHQSYAGTGPSRVVATSSAWCLRHGPNFLVIGAQRCGTTLLHRLLEGHREVFVPRHRKEIHYFDEHYERGEGWYRAFFPFDREGLTAIGEVSPSYLADPNVPERIHAFDPNMRLVVMLRHPIERLWSAFHHLHRVNGVARTFEAFILEDLDALERGKYAEQLSRYAARFPREQMLAVVLEDLILDPDTHLLRIRRFLELQEPWVVDRADLLPRVNENFNVRYPTLYRGARRAGHVLTDRLDDGRIASRVKQSRAMSLFKGGEIFETMTPELRSTLNAYYAPDVARLRDEFGVDTASWGFQPSIATDDLPVALLSAPR